MRQLKIELETVTPLFLGGAQGKGAPPELRPPAFRGAMRYWLRAALGGVIGDRNLEGLKQAERAVFGSTDYGSPIGLRIPFIPFKALRVAKVPILPHKGQGKVPAFKAGQRFELVMTQTRDKRIEVWQAAYTSLQLALTFGGVGLRSRRGYGTLRVVKVEGKGLSVTPQKEADWPKHLQRVTKRAIKAAIELAEAEGIPLKGLPKGPANFPCATHKGVIRLGAAQYSSAMDAVIAFMSKVPQKDFVGGIRPRQASPLWLRPVKMGHKYGLLFVVLASDFKGQDYDALNELLSRFKGQNISVERWNA
jgi:CRISPR-associated protein Cmr1